jgi:uncharacterized protein (DUF433 family)
MAGKAGGVAGDHPRQYVVALGPSRRSGVSWEVTFGGMPLGSRMIAQERRVERITIDTSRMRGLPCIRDTRVTVSAVLGQLAAGRTFDQLLEDYRYLEVEDILAALSFAAEAMQERELPLAQPA